MENKHKTLRQKMQKLRFKSIFTINLFSMSLLCMLCMLMLTVFFVQKIATTSKKTLLESSQAHLESAVQNIDYLIGNTLHQSLVQLSYSHSVLSLATADTFSSQDINTVISDISFAAKYNTMISGVALYYPQKNQIFLSDYNRYSLEDYPDRSMIQQYENQEVSFSDIEKEGKIATFFSYEEQYVLAFDFPLHGKKRLATLYFFIDMPELETRIQKSIASDGILYIRKEDGTPVFLDQMICPADLATALDGEGIRKEHAWESYEVFEDTSDVLGWDYIYLINQSAFSIGLGEILRVFLPVLFLVLLFATAGSYAVASMIYRPVKRLIAKIGENQYAGDLVQASKSEMDYLNLAFSNMDERNDRLMDMMTQVSEDVTTRLFMELFMGNSINSSEIRSLLEGMESPFKMEASYVVCVIKMQQDLSKDNRQRKQVEQELSGFMEKYVEKKDIQYHIVYAGGQTFGVVLSFAVTAPILIMKRTISEFRQDMEMMLQDRKMGFDFGVGNIYQSIADIGFSYAEAYRAVLECVQERGKSAEPEEMDSQEEEQTKENEQVKLISAQDLQLRVQQVFSLVQTDELSGAKDLQERIIRDGMEVMDGLEKQREYYIQYMKTLADCLIHLRDVNMAAFSDDLIVVDMEQIDDLNETELEKQLQQNGNKILDILAKVLKRNQNHFFLETKEYVQTHYQDTSLSLNMVAEAVGANPSYISRLYKEILGISFTNYLTNCRMKASLELLKNQREMTIKDIAAASGFNTIQNYMRLFKKYYGKTPSQYREDEYL